MKNAKIIISIIIACILLLSVKSLAIETETSVDTENYSARTYIDNPVEGQVPSVKGILEINGWYLSDDEQAQIEVLIDDVKQEIKEITRETRQDVIDAIPGYGGIEKNPQPGYKLKVDISQQTTGKHELKVNIISRDGEVLTTDIREFNVERYKAKTYIETPAEGKKVSVGAELNVDGWVMTDDIESQLKIYVDGQEQPIIETKRTERKDVISAITGYGSQTQNPTPGYSLKINLENIKDGNHELSLKVISREGIVIAEETRAIKVEKYKAKMYLENPYNNKTVKPEFEIGGWVMATYENATINAYIDGQKQEIKNLIRKERNDVVSAITGYGDSKTNPTPGFEGTIQLSNILEGTHNFKIEVISPEGIAIATETVVINVENYKTRTYIETPSEGREIGPYEDLKVDGWLMTDAKDAQIEILIDGVRQENIQIQRLIRNDVINAVQGYGGIENNPTPGFSIKVDLSEISGGKHEIELRILSNTGEILSRETKNITHKKYKTETHIETPQQGSEITLKDNFRVDGWVMTEEESIDIKLYIDNEEMQNISIERLVRDDVISAMGAEYGGIEKNPTPGFSIPLNIEEISDGAHIATIKIFTPNGQIVATSSTSFVVNKYIAEANTEAPKDMGQSKATMLIGGWLMSTDSEAQIKIYINNEEQEIIEVIRKERQDVIDGVFGYGDAETNPTPGFEAEIDISKYEDGIYELKVEIVSREGKIMHIETRRVVIYNKYDIGIDVSKHNGSIDWEQVKKSGIQFAIIRAGNRGYGDAGNMVEDPYFVQNMNGAIANGIKVGVYYYSQAITVEEAIQEAEATLRMIQDNGFSNSLSLPIVIDTEAAGGRADSMTKEQRTTVVKAFCERIKQAGYTPMVYSNKSWLENNLIMSELEQYEVWVAHYVETDDPINNPTNYQGRYEIWQYTSEGSVPGISGKVDIDISYKKYF